jgi:hypothetical protein
MWLEMQCSNISVYFCLYQSSVISVNVVQCTVIGRRVGSKSSLYCVFLSFYMYYRCIYMFSFNFKIIILK